MKKIFMIILIMIPIVTSCNMLADSEKQKELELRERELALREKELQIKEQSLPIETKQTSTDRKSEKLSVNELSNIEHLIGFWFVPHGADINIKFKRDGTFQFNDYNSILEEKELLTGIYKLENGTLTLLYDDRPKQNFKFYKGKDGDLNFYIEKSGYFFVKGENQN